MRRAIHSWKIGTAKKAEGARLVGGRRGGRERKPGREGEVASVEAGRLDLHAGWVMVDHKRIKVNQLSGVLGKIGTLRGARR